MTMTDRVTALDHVAVSFTELAQALDVEEVRRAWVVDGFRPEFGAACGPQGDVRFSCDWRNLVTSLGMQGEPWRVWVEQEQDYVHVVTRWAVPGDAPSPFKLYARGSVAEARSLG